MRDAIFKEAVSGISREAGIREAAVGGGRAAVDQAFIERLKAGDPEAFEILAERYTGEIYRLVLRLSRDVEEAEDLTQEVFLKAVRGIGSFRGDSEIRTWLYRIALNATRSKARWWNRRGKDKTVSIESTIGSGETTIGEALASAVENPEQILLRKEREAMLHGALGEIAANYREAVILCDLQGLKYEEIAELLGTNVGTVKSRIARGREELRKRLKGI